VSKPERRKNICHPGRPSGVVSQFAPVMPPPCHINSGTGMRGSERRTNWTYIWPTMISPFGSIGWHWSNEGRPEFQVACGLQRRRQAPASAAHAFAPRSGAPAPPLRVGVSIRQSARSGRKHPRANRCAAGPASRGDRVAKEIMDQICRPAAFPMNEKHLLSVRKAEAHGRGRNALRRRLSRYEMKLES
jgi:hypothetical protein